jgi:hypothetical protein
LQQGQQEGVLEPTVSTLSTTARLQFGETPTPVLYLETDDWLLDSNNGQALFVTGIGNICTGQPGGVAFLARAVDVVDLQAAYVLGVLNYYKHGTTDHVFNLIRRIYGEVPIGLLVAGRSWTDEGIHDEDEAHIACVWY